MMWALAFALILSIGSMVLSVFFAGRLDTMASELDDLTRQVAANKDLTNSAISLIRGLAGKIEAAGTDPVKLKALTDDLKAQDDALAAAITANTPFNPSANG
jgi:hypothetical protein